MQAEQVESAFFLKFWPWFEANLKKIIIGAVVVVIAAGIAGFYVWQQNQKQIAAGEAYTGVIISQPENSSDAYLTIAGKYSGTAAGARSLLQAATVLFTQEKYADAQKQFQRFLDGYPNNALAGQASLGLAACLDAQGQTNAAAGAYQNTINQHPDENAADYAKFSLARIYDSQGKANDARNFYSEVARSNPYSSLGQKAELRLEEMKSFAAVSAPSNLPKSNQHSP